MMLVAAVVIVVLAIIGWAVSRRGGQEATSPAAPARKFRTGLVIQNAD